MKKIHLLLLAFIFSVISLWAQEPVARIELHTQPEDRKVRPFEGVVVQLQAFAERIDSEGKKQSVRLKKNMEHVSIQDEGGGWLSKPFLFQGNSMLSSEVKGLDRLSSLRNLGETFVWQDSVLFTAPEKAGKYHVEAELEGKKVSVELEVTPSAPTYKKPEEVNFPTEPANSDPYFPLVEHYAPFICQETWFTPKADFITRFDLDGDWKGDDNWDDMEIGTSQAYVYYAVMETPTHWFLIYNLYHPRDYSDRCVAGTCHENDNEGIILTVAKDGSQLGRLQVMETLAHNNIYAFRNDRRIQNGVHGIDGEIEFMDESHPLIFIESGGHGIYGSSSRHARLKNKLEFTAGTGVTYQYKGIAERPRHANDRNISYALIPIYREWWERMKEGNPVARIMFDDYFTYAPYGNRPTTSLPRIAGAFLGRKEASNKARPFWGWFDVQTQKKKVLSTGEWGLDPAYSVSQNLRFPKGEPFSIEYIFNPYLSIGTETPGASSSASAASSSLPTRSELVFKRAGSFLENRDSGTLDLHLVVDGKIAVFVQYDHIYYEVDSGRPPRDEGTEMNQPLPSSNLKKLDFEKKDGRGSVQLIARPDSSNHYTLQLLIDDPKKADDHYHIRISWKR
jgi:hypothetical protein